MNIPRIASWPSASVRLGWPGKLALMVSAAGAAGYFALIEPESARLHALERQAESFRLQAAGGKGAGRTGLASAEAQLAEFYRLFPGEAGFVDWMTKVSAIAQEGGLSLDQGEYEVEPEVVGRLARYQVTLPLRGDYLRIRHFLGALAKAAPMTALEQVRFERRKIGDTVVDARVRLVLYMVAGS